MTTLILKFTGSYIGLGMFPVLALCLTNYLVSPKTDWFGSLEPGIWTAQVGWTCVALWLALRMFPEIKGGRVHESG